MGRKVVGFYTDENKKVRPISSRTGRGRFRVRLGVTSDSVVRLQRRYKFPSKRMTVYVSRNSEISNTKDLFDLYQGPFGEGFLASEKPQTELGDKVYAVTVEGNVLNLDRYRAVQNYLNRLNYQFEEKGDRSAEYEGQSFLDHHKVHVIDLGKDWADEATGRVYFIRGGKIVDVKRVG